MASSLDRESFFELYRPSFFNAPVTDFHCGLRGFSKAAIKRLDLQVKGMEFASEMIIKATLSNLRITEFPITLHPDGRTRKSHLRTWRDGWRHLRFMLIFSPSWLFLYPGFFLMLLGITGFVLLIPGPFIVGPIGFDVNTLLVASAFVTIGFQCLIFWVFTRVFATTEGFLPIDPFLQSLFGRIKLETGLAIGVFFVTVGIALLVIGGFYWARHGFGRLPYEISLRIVIPAVTLLSLGVQALFSSFFLSFLGLKRKRLL